MDWIGQTDNGIIHSMFYLPWTLFEHSLIACNCSGWAPQQILAWVGLERYGYQEEAERLAYRWLYMITKAFVDYNGVVVEKYDVTRPIDPHRVDAEYGNQGLDFRGVAREGYVEIICRHSNPHSSCLSTNIRSSRRFGWVNASFQLGLTIVNSHMRRALGACVAPDAFFSATDAEKEGLLLKWGASPPGSPRAESPTQSLFPGTPP